MAWMHRVAPLALAAGVTLAGCSPNAPTDGFFGCSLSDPGQCPSAFPYCQSDGRCHATPETDTGPRPDTGPLPDTGPADAFMGMPGTVGRYGACTGGPDCQSGLQCISLFCLEGCASMGAPCARGGVCAPHALTGASDWVCLDPCPPSGGACPNGGTRRTDPMMAAVCHCVPSGPGF